MSEVISFTFSPFQENTYLIIDNPTKETVIIDPGCLAQHEKETLANYISENNLLITHLLQTHTHLDHVFGSAFIKRKYGVKMLMHKADLPVLADVATRCHLWGIQGYEPVEADAFLEEGDIITFGNTQLEVVHVPGHAPGHIAFINHADNYIIGGDCLFQGSIGRTDFPLCSFDALMNSIKTKFYTLPDNYVVYAGHNDPTTIGHEKKYNPFVR